MTKQSERGATPTSGHVIPGVAHIVFVMTPPSMHDQKKEAAPRRVGSRLSIRLQPQLSIRLWSSPAGSESAGMGYRFSNLPRRKRTVRPPGKLREIAHSWERYLGTQGVRLDNRTRYTQICPIFECLLETLVCHVVEQAPERHIRRHLRGFAFSALLHL